MQSTRHYPRFREHHLRIFHDGSQKRRESFGQSDGSFIKDAQAGRKRSALLSNLINILRRDCNSTLFRTITMSSKFLGISIFLRKFIVFVSKTRKLRAEVRTERFEVAMLHASGYLNYDINTQDSSSDKMKEETY